MKITADVHFGHANIRTYETGRLRWLGLTVDSTTEDHDDALEALWNAQVEPDEEVIIVGDLFMGNLTDSLARGKRLNGRKFLVPGNHDRMHPMQAKSQEKRDRMTGRYNEEADVIIYKTDFTMDMDGIEVRVNHFPYEGDHKEVERGGEFRPIRAPYNRPLVHGHVHSMWKTNGNQFNVGLDAWEGLFCTPEQIAAYFRSL
jgi:calcineurin-like phosphoesterase family protein